MKKFNEKIKEIIENLIISHDEDEGEETVDEYLSYLDSIRFIELITAVESEFEIEIETSDLVQDNIKNLDVFAAMVKKYINV